MNTIKHNMDINTYSLNVNKSKPNFINSIKDENRYERKKIDGICEESNTLVRKERKIFGEDDREYFYDIKEVEYDKYKSSLSIAKITFKDGTGGTAWRVGPGNLMMTSAHVISDKDIRSAKIEFSDKKFFWNESKFGAFYSSYNDNVVVNADKLLYKSGNEDKDLDYALFSLDPLDFNKKLLDKFSYLDIDHNPLKECDEIYIPQYGIIDEDGNEKFISMDHSVCSDNINSDAIVNIGEPGVVKTINGPLITYNLDTTSFAEGAPILSNRTNQVIGMNISETTDSNIGVSMNAIWPRIKSFYEDSQYEDNVKTSRINVIT